MHLMDFKKLCVIFDVSPSHARRRVKTGAWPVYKFGPRSYRFDVEELKERSRLPTVDQDSEKGGHQ